jgi:hypothetical protein
MKKETEKDGMWEKKEVSLLDMLIKKRGMILSRTQFS